MEPAFTRWEMCVRCGGEPQREPNGLQPALYERVLYQCQQTITGPGRQSTAGAAPRLLTVVLPPQDAHRGCASPLQVQSRAPRGRTC
jgi:hypothetical protein